MQNNPRYSTAETQAQGFGIFSYCPIKAPIGPSLHCHCPYKAARQPEPANGSASGRHTAVNRQAYFFTA
ncbi:hypothetical protein ACTHTM_09955, partial [Neisseria sp. P0018.S003]